MARTLRHDAIEARIVPYASERAGPRYRVTAENLTEYEAHVVMSLITGMQRVRGEDDKAGTMCR